MTGVALRSGFHQPACPDVASQRQESVLAAPWTSASMQLFGFERYTSSMANIEQHTPGSFCWVELCTTDPQAAKTFYGSLFGWAAVDRPMGADNLYSTFQLEGRDTGAVYPMRPGQRARRTSAHWMIYVAVERAHLVASTAARLGGTVVAGPMDVLDTGRMAVIEDPMGATFALWQAKTHHGIGIAGVEGTLCWADLNTPDRANSSGFYGELFGWKTIKDQRNPADYLQIMNGDEMIGSIPPGASADPGVPAHWLAYFIVSDCDKKAKDAKQLGATSLTPPTVLEGIGRFEALADPQGAAFAIFEPAPRG